jgi:CRISPR system Cascade subunit CasE
MSFRTVCKFAPLNRDVELDLADRNLMHKRLMSLFPDGLGSNPRQAINLLFVADPINNELMLQSDVCPVVGPLCDTADKYFTRVITKDLETSGLNFESQDTVEFMFWFAALERSTRSNKRVAIGSDDGICKKATAVLSNAGLDVGSISIIDSQPIISKSRGINYLNVQLAGTGVVTDDAKLKASIIKGIGSGRLWGSGMLTATRII